MRNTITFKETFTLCLALLSALCFNFWKYVFWSIINLVAT